MESFIQSAASFLPLPACRSVEYVYILLHSAPESTKKQSRILYKLNLNTYLLLSHFVLRNVMMSRGENRFPLSRIDEL